jgi:LysW-gamma-L-lysine carboxypeptidase
MSLPESARLLADLVAIPSPTGQEEAAARMLKDSLPRFGWDASHLDGCGNVVASRGFGDSELILMGHIDTVMGGPKVVIEEDRIQGRGSVDAKGPCCAMAAAGGVIPIPPGWRVTFVGAVGEEIDSRGSRFRMPLHSPAACVIGEPTGSDGVALSYRGRVFFIFESEDGGAHRSGSPGPMTDAVLATASLVDISKNMTGYTASVVEMEGREAGTRYGRIAVDLRLPISAVREEVETMLEETAAAFGRDLSRRVLITVF